MFLQMESGGFGDLHRFVVSLLFFVVNRLGIIAPFKPTNSSKYYTLVAMPFGPNILPQGYKAGVRDQTYTVYEPGHTWI